MITINYKLIFPEGDDRKPFLLLSDIEDGIPDVIRLKLHGLRVGSVTVEGNGKRLNDGAAEYDAADIAEGINRVTAARGSEKLFASPILKKDGKIFRSPADDAAYEKLIEAYGKLCERVATAEKRLLTLEDKLLPMELLNFN